MGTIGRMRKRAEIIEVQQGQGDNLGGYITEKVVVATVWCQITEQDGTREFESMRVSNKNPYEITLRAGTYKVTPDNLIRENDIEYTVMSVRRDEDKRFTVCQCWA